MIRSETIHTSQMSGRCDHNLALTMVVTLRCSQDALVMMSELNKINSIALAVVGVDLLSALQVVQTH